MFLSETYKPLWQFRSAEMFFRLDGRVSTNGAVYSGNAPDHLEAVSL